MKQTATLHFLRMAPRKVRLVADLIRGMSVNGAEAQLMYERRRAAKPLLKLLRSAIANVKNNRRESIDNLVVSTIRVDQGPIFRSFKPAAQGRAMPQRKRLCHMSIVIESKESSKRG